MDSVLRPRDIQTRIRSGESPETVASAAQTTVDVIMPYASPVLAERAFVAQQAQRASVRRRAGDGAPGQLGAAVAERLRAESLDPDDVEWDAWRRDDGRWTLVAAYDAEAGPQRAEFVYDAAGRYVTATDEPSRHLVGERATAAGAAPADASQLHLGDDAIELVTGHRPEPVVEPVESVVEPVESVAAALEPVAVPAEPAVQPDEVTVDLTEPAAAVRPIRAVGDAAPDAGWMATQASERPAGRPPETLFDVPGDSPHDDSPQDDSVLADSAAPTGEDPEQPAAAGPAARPRSKGRAKGRAAIPSWDEIMFGSSTGE